MKSLIPLGLRVLLVELANGCWCLSDGWRFSRSFTSSAGAMNDKTNFWRLDYGYELKGGHSKV